MFDPLAALIQPQPGRARRISSNEQPNWSDGNFDMTPLPAGAVLELPLLEGPGYINHIWLTSHAGGVGELSALSLRIYWDGRDEPGVEVPLGEFFAVGQGRPAPVDSIPVQVSPSGSLTCYWRMPFQNSARIVIRNDNPDHWTGLYWQIDWVQLPSLPEETPYFHAAYRQEYPCVMGRDYLVADLEGSGHFVGSVVSVTMAQDGWFGEGDDFFFIDGEEVPSLQGTGTEDYFNDAWGFRTRTGPWFGQPRWQGYQAGDSGVCYRWHVLDPVPFTRSLRLTIEHKGNRPESEDAWFIERPDFWNSVALWYQTGEPKRFGELPAWQGRTVPWEQKHLVRAFRQALVTESRPPEIRTQGFFGGRPALAWGGEETAAGATLTFPFKLGERGRYAVRLTAFPSSRPGRYAVLLDGEAVQPEAELGAGPGETDLLLGARELDAGEHRLTFRALDAGRELVVEMLRLLKLPPEAQRTVKTHNEAHFIRLGIGRATYAYRLAYGELPASLEALVECGVMPERYLRDENGHPLRSRLEGERLTVESTASEGWSHAWTGRDARS